MSTTYSRDLRTPSTHPGGDVTDDEVDRDALTHTLFRCITDSAVESERSELRSQIVTLHAPVAESIARRYFGHGEDSDDLRQVALLGLTKAAAGFDPGRGYSFLPYAIPTISGEIKKHFRDRCWSIRPPRRIQELQQQISAAREELSHALHRSPSDDEIAQLVGCQSSQVREAATAHSCFTPNSLDKPLQVGGTTTLGDAQTGDDGDFNRMIGHVVLAPLLAKLSEADRELLTLRFYDDLTQERIAQRVGITQMQVSRKLSRLLGQLRALIEDQPAQPAEAA